VGRPEIRAAHKSQKVGGPRPAWPNRLRRQWQHWTRAESDIYDCLVLNQKLQSSLSSDRRLPELVIMVKRLPGNADSEDAKVLAQSVDDLVTQNAETVRQVEARLTSVNACLQRWTQFDDNYQKLLSAVSVIQMHVNATKTSAAEDAIDTVENVSVCDHT